MIKELWKSIPGFEGCYECSNLARIKSLKRKGKLKDYILSERKDNYGYLHVLLCKGGVMYPRRVHRLVALLFVPNPKHKPHVNHIDGNKGNSKYTNLEWCTHKENIIHSFTIGNRIPGRAKLSELQVLEIYKSKESPAFLSNKYNVTGMTIRQIKKGQTWKKLTHD